MLMISDARQGNNGRRELRCLSSAVLWYDPAPDYSANFFGGGYRLMNRTLLGLVVLSMLLSSAMAVAQKPVKGPNPAQAKAAAVVTKSATTSEADLQDLVKTLENDAERKKLISRLNAMIAAKKGVKAAEPKKNIGAHALDLISARLDRVSTEFVAGTRALMDLPNVYDWVSDQLADDKQRSRWIEIGWKLIVAILIGLIGEWVVRRLLARPRTALETKTTDSLWVKMISLFARTVLDVVPIIGFLGASYTVLVLVQPGAETRDVAVTIIYANVLVRVVIAIAHLLLAPAAPALRLFPLADVDANYLFIWTRRFADLVIYGYFFVVALGPLGMPESGAEALVKILGLLVTLAVIVFILQNRNNVATWLRGNGEATMVFRSSRSRFADIWHVLIILYVVALYGVWTLAANDGFQFVLQASAITLVILVVARVGAGLLRRALRRLFSLKDDVRHRYPGLEARANRYLPILENSVSIIFALITLFAVLEAWGIESFEWLATPIGQKMTGSVITIALLLVVTVVMLEVISAAIERYLSRDGVEVSTRARTLLPLLRTTLLVVLVTMFVLITLSELGLNIAPLLAGAGVVGLAIGFGAQTLVKDIITGMFILMEDQLAVGDVVKVGTHAGVVESLTLRTIRLRDLAGTVHVVPFSEVTTLENMTKDFSRYVFEVGVAYREDTDEVVEALKQVGDDLIQDENFKDLIVAPLEVLGVDKFGDNAVVIKARITTKPIKQWQVGREFNRRMKKRFDALGIEIPFPHRTIYFGEDKAGDSPVARVAMVDGNSGRAGSPQESPSTQQTRRGSIAATPETGGVDAPDGE
jgi:small conductance mechanosensitive channel